MDLAAQDRWSQSQANLYLGTVAESSAEPQAASSYFRDVACQRPYGDSALLPVALSISRSLIPRACEVRARCAEVTERSLGSCRTQALSRRRWSTVNRFSKAGRRRWRLARPRRRGSVQRAPGRPARAPSAVASSHGRRCGNHLRAVVGRAASARSPVRCGSTGVLALSAGGGGGI